MRCGAMILIPPKSVPTQILSFLSTNIRLTILSFRDRACMPLLKVTNWSFRWYMFTPFLVPIMMSPDEFLSISVMKLEEMRIIGIMLIEYAELILGVIAV